ncbi:uncharacterized protein LOC117924607 [Vitis riparia]|uniref:uncharacterized protein LOC117924607 n=1 Tax=Vitis riparia TaxID=96939 RepID=UPI00155B2247|nr:uncharacterized protein LOC117924607 [Vitis riparia]
MEWWKKMKRVWVAVSSHVKLRKAGGGGSSSGGGGADGVAGGLLKLREDVLACGYEDVQVMWKMLHGSPSETTTFEEVSCHPPEVTSHPAKCSKRRSWRAFF